MKIGVLGATGPAGGGLAARLASVGYDVIAGSRDPARAEAAVAKARDRWGDRVRSLEAGGNADAATAEVIVVGTQWEAAVPTASQHADALSGKVVVAMANGLTKVDREFRPVLPDEGSLAMAMQAAVPQARIAAALQHIPAVALGDLDHFIDSDVIVCADDADARTTVLDLVARIPDLRGFDGGSLANAVGIEAFAAVLLTINLRHKGKASLRLVGVEPRPSAGP
ncbi:MAG TPA: NADPH-dependent F420 reductase [Acidimicrobiia bacterium]|jgi:8-hydroxy-5-deazaflavin:NADPH oxidoreductase|nr:NADPH-dependent F420 reductase [Acidimicrobiia bacterium]